MGYVGLSEGLHRYMPIHHCTTQGKPLFLMVTQKAMKAVPQDMIDPLYLPTILRVIGGHGEGLDAKESEKFPSESGDELGTLVQYNAYQ